MLIYHIMVYLFHNVNDTKFISTAKNGLQPVVQMIPAQPQKNVVFSPARLIGLLIHMYF